MSHYVSDVYIKIDTRKVINFGISLFRRPDSAAI